MCFNTRVAEPSAAPSRASVSANPKSKLPAGVLGNIFTTALGDSGYKASVAKLATLGGK